MFEGRDKCHQIILEDIHSRLSSVLLGTPNISYPLHEPEFSGNETKYLQNCIESQFVSSAGKFVDDFEDKLANYTGAKYVVLTVNGTTALQLALEISGVSSGSEVLMPSLTFVATANAVSQTGATPHFVDVDATRLTMCPVLLENYLKEICEMKDGLPVNRRTKRKISAILPMHTFGHPADMFNLKKVATKFNIALVEDAAEALGSFINGKHLGTMSKVGVLSFNGNKIITTGGGGALLTNDRDLATRARHLSTTAKVPHGWRFIHDEVGYNYRMPNVNAAIGLAQLEIIGEKRANKRELASQYIKAFATSKYVKILEEPKKCNSNYWLNTIILKNASTELQDYLIYNLHKEKIFVRPVWEPLHSLTPYNKCPHTTLANTEALATRILSLPSSPQIVKYQGLPL